MDAEQLDTKIQIAKDREAVHSLGAWIGNRINDHTLGNGATHSNTLGTSYTLAKHMHTHMQHTSDTSHTQYKVEKHIGHITQVSGTHVHTLVTHLTQCTHAHMPATHETHENN